MYAIICLEKNHVLNKNGQDLQSVWKMNLFLPQDEDIKQLKGFWCNLVDKLIA